jgi:nucleoid-associated protein YgaU
MLRKRLVRMLLLAAVLLVALYFARQWPKDQTVHYVLGDAASRVEEVDARWAPGIAATEDWTREATFRYPPGKAPRIVTHEPRLPDGDYTVEIEIVAASAASATSATTAKNEVVVRKHVILGGGATSIQLADLVPQ